MPVPVPAPPPAGAEHLAHVDDRLLWLLRSAGHEWGPLGVALAAAHMTDPHTVAARLLRSYPEQAPSPSTGVHEACEEQADALRAEVARLSALLDEFRACLPGPMPATDAEALLRLRTERDEAREDADRYATALTTLEHERDTARTAVEHNLREVARLTDELDACRRQQGRQAATIAGHPSVDADPRRPHLDSWPDDAVLLRYRELRDLVALHLDRYCDGDSARAMRDGDVPLRLAEVLDRG